MIDLFPLTVEFATPLPQAIDLLGQELQAPIASCLLVMDGLELVGILTDWDVVRLLASGMPVDSKFTVADVMMQPVTTLRETELHEPFNALSLLRQQQINHLPIVDSASKLVGLITPATIQQSLQPTNLLKLYRVRDVMGNQVVHANPHTSVLELAQLMMAHHVNNVVIVDEDAEQDLVPIGLVTARDILCLQTRGGDLVKTSAQTIMQAPLFCLNPADSLWLACEEMRQRQVRCLVVIDLAGKLLGLVMQADLLRSLDLTEMQKSLRQLWQSLRQSETKTVNQLHSRAQELERVVQTRNAQLEEQAKCDRLLATTTLQIHQSLNLEETLNTTVSEVRKLLQTDRAIIYRLQSDGSGVVVMESVQPGWMPMLGKSIYDQAFVEHWLDAYQHGRIQAIDDIYKAGLSPGYINLLAEFQVRANLVVPILSNQQLWGLLITQHCGKSWRWQNWEIRLLEQLVKQVGIAIQQSELFQRVQMELSERQRLEGELAQLFNLSPDLVGMIGVDGYFKRLNPAFTKTLGYTHQELLAKPLLSFVHPDDRATTQTALEQLASGEQPLSYFESRYRCQDETYKWLAWTVAPDDPTQGLLYTIARDITEQKEAAARQIN
jgi:PAS domain S-box-containing protein